MSYDAWKADAPNPGSGSYDTEANARGLFWQAYRYAVLHRCVEAWLHTYRGMPAFAALVGRADQMVCGNCETHVLPLEDLCPDCRRGAAIYASESDYAEQGR